MTTRCKAIRDWYLRMCYAQASRLNCHPIGVIVAIVAIVLTVVIGEHPRGFLTGVDIVLWGAVGILCAAVAAGVAWLTRLLWRVRPPASGVTAAPGPGPAQAPATWPFLPPDAGTPAGTPRDRDATPAALTGEDVSTDRGGA